MRRTTPVFASALLFFLSARPAAAQLEIVEPPSAEPERAFEPSMAVHAGLRASYAALGTAEASIDEAVVGGVVFGIALQHEAWRIFDMRLQLLQFGAGWSDARDPELVSQVGLQLGTGVRARAGIVSFAATALVGFGAWLAPGDPVTLDVGGELSITFHAGCEALELGYQALASLSAGGFAEAPSHGVLFRWIVTNGGPEWDACREERR